MNHAADLERSFLGNAIRIGEPGYIPDQSDVLRARQKSTRITEARFNVGKLRCV